jgi:hypothetical protein
VGREKTVSWKIGVALFFLAAGFTGMSQAGFFPPLALGLPILIAIATVGGGIGGALMAGRETWLLGTIGGLIAGPCGLIAVYYYAQWRRPSVYMIEIALVQGLAGLPGLFVFRLLRKLKGVPAQGN